MGFRFDLGPRLFLSHEKNIVEEIITNVEIQGNILN